MRWLMASASAYFRFGRRAPKKEKARSSAIEGARRALESSTGDMLLEKRSCLPAHTRTDAREDEWSERVCAH